MKVCSNGPGHVMPIYGKIFSPGFTLTYFTARSNLVSYAFVWEKGKIMYFSETIVVYRFGQLNEYMNLYEYQWSWSFIDLRPRLLRFNIFKLLLLRNR